MVHLNARPSLGFFSSTPNGHATTQYAQPLQTSGCTNTAPKSMRTIAPVGHASRQPATSQCLQTSDEKLHVAPSGALPPNPGAGPDNPPGPLPSSTNFT